MMPIGGKRAPKKARSGQKKGGRLSLSQSLTAILWNGGKGAAQEMGRGDGGGGREATREGWDEMGWDGTGSQDKGMEEEDRGR